MTSFGTVGAFDDMRWTSGGSLVDTKSKRYDSGDGKEDLDISLALYEDRVDVPRSCPGKPST